MTKVLVVDDHEFIRIGICHFLEGQPDIEVVGTAADGGEALQLCRRLRPDVVLMDLAMAGMDGVEATARAVEEMPDLRVIVLTSFSDRDRIMDAIDAGAVGYLLKDSDPEEILRGIKAAARGESPVSPRAANAILQARRVRLADSDLTARELEIVRLVGEGLANKQIARNLGISEKTVKAHLVSAFQKIGVGDRTQAALWARRRGYTSG